MVLEDEADLTVAERGEFLCRDHGEVALLLADEPTGSLDRVSATGIGQLLVELNCEEGVTLVVVTHSPELAGLMGRTVELRDGKFVPVTK